MQKLLASPFVLCASAVLFAAGLTWQSKAETHPAAPTSLTVIVDHTLASGPTIPPGPWDDDDTGSDDTKIASGPTIPPGPWDDDDTGSDDTKIASGPTIPPGPWDDDDTGSDDTKIARVVRTNVGAEV